MFSPRWSETILKFWALKNCQHYTSNDNCTFTDWFAFDDLTEATPKGFLARLKFFALADKDVHVLLSPTKIPRALRTDWRYDENLYQIEIGSKRNTRNVIWSSKENDNLFYKITQKGNVLRKDEPNAILIELTEDGEFKVLLNNSIIMEVQEIDPLHVKYFSFASWCASNEYFFNCNSHQMNGDLKNFFQSNCSIK